MKLMLTLHESFYDAQWPARYDLREAPAALGQHQVGILR
jgi:hypothetical protein